MKIEALIICFFMFNEILICIIYIFLQQRLYPIMKPF